MTRPNILIVMADQLAPQFTGAYGHKVVKTPNIDVLAARGRRFDAAYCNSPLCAPSRFSFMAGKHVTKIGAWDNAAEFPASVPTFAHYLRAAGYRTCLSGKMHFVGPDQLHGFDERLTTDVYPSDFAWVPDWERNGERIDKWYHNMATVRESGTASATYQLDFDDETAFAARRRIFDFARDREHPWCMVASFIHPHDPYVARPEWWRLYEGSEIDLPVVRMDPKALDPFARRVADGIEASVTPLTDDQIRTARRAYYANVSYVDSLLGSLLGALEETGEIDNTVVIVTADHGDALGERGLWYKMTWFEHSARVPLILTGPGIVPGVSAAPCSLVDILPTLCEIAGYEGPFGMEPDGRSLLPEARGGEIEDAEAVGEYCAEMAGAPVLMIRRGRWKYIHCRLDPPQLYDLEADPGERMNLAEDPVHAELVAAFAAEVARRWDCAALEREIRASQRRRFAVHAAMQSGERVDWDYAPPYRASEKYVRNHMDWTVAAARYRYPPVGG